MEKKLLWSFLVILLGLNLGLLYESSRAQEAVEARRGAVGEAEVKAEYADEEEALLLADETWPLGGSEHQDSGFGSAGVLFLLVVSVDDCTNCIEDEVEALQELALGSPEGLIEVHGYFVDEDRAETARSFVQRLVGDKFPMEVRDVLRGSSVASTPLVLVVDGLSGQVVDAHKPIPGDLSKRDAFYRHWARLFDISDFSGGTTRGRRGSLAE